MSFSDRSLLTAWQKLGCAIYFFVAFLFCYSAVIVVVFDGWDEPPMPKWQSLLLFPGSALLALAGGVLLSKFFMRDRD